MIWKILTLQIREEIYYSPISRGLFPEERKGYHRGKRGTGGLLYIYKRILKERKTKPKNVAIAWIDNKSLRFSHTKLGS